MNQCILAVYFHLFTTVFQGNSPLTKITNEESFSFFSFLLMKTIFQWHVLFGRQNVFTQISPFTGVHCIMGICNAITATLTEQSSHYFIIFNVLKVKKSKPHDIYCTCSFPRAVLLQTAISSVINKIFRVSFEVSGVEKYSPIKYC